jgi:type III restriction enzyme
VSDSLPEVLNELREALESNGFTRAEAERIIIPVSQGALPLGAQPKTVQVSPADIDQTVTKSQVTALAGKARIDTDSGAITVLAPLDQVEAEKLASCVKTPEAKAKVAEAVELVRELDRAFGGSGKTREPSPYELQLDFIVPLLCVREDGHLFEFESTFLLEHPWKLSAKDASLADGYNPLKRPVGKAGLIDIGTKGEVQTEMLQDQAATDFVATLHQQVIALGGADDWKLEDLVGWLDRHIDHQDIPAGESAEFLRRVVRGLMAKFGIAEINVLALDRFRLREQVEERIQQHRDNERKTAFQQFLLDGSALTVSEERAINFKTMSYEPSWLYGGGFKFKKHYFGPKPGELLETTPGGKLKEEFECARFLDGLPEVKFWVRNLANKATSFRLQTSQHWFYPDFLCQLDAGRVLVVEYKGGHLFDGAEEKRAVGAVWEGRGGGKYLFVMPKGDDLEAIRRKIGAGR